MTIIGITGGIGSGKSTVSRLLEVMGIPVFIADTEAKRLMNESSVIKEKLIAAFGETIYSDGVLNRKELARHIFGDKNAITYVNSVVHPAVEVDFNRWGYSQPHPVVAIESAILFESGFDRLTNLTVTVTAPLDIRVERVMQRDNSTREDVMSRINNQLSENERNARANIIIVNDGVQALIPQVSFIFQKEIVPLRESIVHRKRAKEFAKFELI